LDIIDIHNKIIVNWIHSKNKDKNRIILKYLIKKQHLKSITFSLKYFLKILLMQPILLMLLYLLLFLIQAVNLLMILLSKWSKYH